MQKPTSDAHRLFFALWPDEPTCTQLERAARAVSLEDDSGGRPTNPARYHVTLQFLGDFSPWPEALFDRAARAAQKVRVPAFDLVLDTTGSFGGGRVWWLGCSSMPPALESLWNLLGAELAAHDVPVRAHPQFTPHLTIRRNARRRLAPRCVEAVRWPIREFVLMDSQPDAGYRELARWPLQA
ncbi:MAG: 2'-5' RNA ligase [uncultured Lysobacter sp.]|uniref:RNA 2',3'-cyclic phosphodiesterase n=1 Tax=uncultured Lysobacter sp. TaxID=271060 RepID=A0A6J4KL09_9GAMM|nr:MAG: 2'-5' RNA ligase [uncultured Lysobacter sp.]